MRKILYITIGILSLALSSCKRMEIELMRGVSYDGAVADGGVQDIVPISLSVQL
jgi:hypothetical protein